MTAAADEGAAGGESPLGTLAASIGDAGRDRDVAKKTRRVVMASLGVMQDQKALRKRNRSVALAATLVVVLITGPLAWLAVDHFAAGGHLGDLTTEFSLWVCILCPALLAAALVAGWLRNR
ncbi:MAG TPA: hypothetical protein VKB38_10365 [Terracidiphilus sp.]|nr:hypothetical protein [Terracidiphilus sp.]